MTATFTARSMQQVNRENKQEPYRISGPSGRRPWLGSPVIMNVILDFRLLGNACG
jgi:hypothetical protein